MSVYYSCYKGYYDDYFDAPDWGSGQKPPDEPDFRCFDSEKEAWEFYRNSLYGHQKEINKLIVEATKKLKTLEN